MQSQTESTQDTPRGAFAKGPRNLPKPDSRKKKRQVVKAARKQNRGVYSGQ